MALSYFSTKFVLVPIVSVHFTTTGIIVHLLLIPVPYVDDEEHGGYDDANDRSDGKSNVNAYVHVRVFVNSQSPIFRRTFAASPPLHFFAYAQIQRTGHSVVLADFHFFVS